MNKTLMGLYAKYNGNLRLMYGEWIGTQDQFVSALQSKNKDELISLLARITFVFKLLKTKSRINKEYFELIKQGGLDVLDINEILSENERKRVIEVRKNAAIARDKNNESRLDNKKKNEKFIKSCLEELYTGGEIKKYHKKQLLAEEIERRLRAWANENPRLGLHPYAASTIKGRLKRLRSPI